MSSKVFDDSSQNVKHGLISHRNKKQQGEKKPGPFLGI